MRIFVLCVVLAGIVGCGTDAPAPVDAGSPDAYVCRVEAGYYLQVGHDISGSCPLGYLSSFLAPVTTGYMIGGICYTSEWLNVDLSYDSNGCHWLATGELVVAETDKVFTGTINISCPNGSACYENVIINSYFSHK